MQPTRIRLFIPDTIDPATVLGPCDSILRAIEQAFEASIVVRGSTVVIIGSAQDVDCITSVFARLIALAEEGKTPTVSDVSDIIDSFSDAPQKAEKSFNDTLLVTPRGHAIKPKTAGQSRYIDAIRDNTITFCTGPAGTGKTYLAMACAVMALKQKQIGRIVLTRPVVEAGESLGFLPGTLEEKLDPYVRPLYDALIEMMDAEAVSMLLEQHKIEIAPLAFMRGRTFNDAFVILDEAQNTTPGQMKMFLTRLGYSTKFVITGDTSQQDVLGNTGLDSARRVLNGIEDIAFVDLTRHDIVRHSLVAKIVDAYERQSPQASL